MIGSLMIGMSTLVFLAGMFIGIAMGISQNFQLAPAHAHLNLVGGVMLFLFGLYYRLMPQVAETLIARLQGGLHMAGAILFPAGIALVLLNGPAYEFAAVAGSLIVVAATLLFAVIVIRSWRA